jgi:hypothetical protein
MDFKTPLTSRNAAVQGGNNNDAGMIVILMMAIVFVPVAIAHAAVMLPGTSGAELAGMFSALLKTF